MRTTLNSGERVRKKLTEEEVQRHAGTVVAQLIGFKATDGVRILAAALDLVATRLETQFPGLIKSGNVNFLPRKHGKLSKIDQDLKMKEFIYGLSERMSIKAIHIKLVEEFGAKRAPCEYTLSKWLKKQRDNGEAT